MTDFDSAARGWDELPGRRDRADAVARAIRAEVALNRKMSAMEYGCGTGLLSFALRPYLGSITLADSSAGMLEVLREKIAAAKVANMVPLQLDLSVDPLPAIGFDLVYTLMTLHHIPDARGILQKLQALLVPAGILCISDLDKEDGTFHEHEFEGHHGFDRDELQAWLLQAGFGSIRFTTPYTMVKGGREYPLFLAIGKKI